MYVKVVARSVMNIDGSVVHSDDISEESENISGLCANVCYSNGYTHETLEDKMKDTEQNRNRFGRVIQNHHDSISDHVAITVYISGISKIVAMVLNSLEFYNTSERSGRYTNVSETASEVEVNLYNKWMDIIYNRISEVYPNISDERKKKLSQENARYFLSVFNKATSMVYTTSYRQWSYIAQWIDDIGTVLESSTSSYQNSKERAFYKKLYEELVELRNHIIDDGFGTLGIVDVKKRHIKFLAYLYDDSVIYGRSYVNDMYKVQYLASFACLADVMRHRTLHYYLDFDGITSKFYVPDILTPDQTLEWLSDMNKVKDLYPQGTLVGVVETGSVDNFILKCKERLCGRAQLEVAKSTANTLKTMNMFRENKKIPNTGVGNMISSMFVDGRVRAKCELIGSCNEHCEFGACGAVSRKI